MANAAQSTLKGLAQAAAIFYVGNFFVQQFVGQKQAAHNVPSFETNTVTNKPITEYASIPQHIAPIWPANSSVDINIYVSPSLAMPGLKHVQDSSLVLKEENFQLGNYSDKRIVDTMFPVPKEAQHNSTLWAHMFIALHGHQLDPKEKDYNVKSAYHCFRPLNQILAKKKVVKTKHLLGGDGEEQEGEATEEKGPVFASYYHPNFTLSFVDNSGVIKFPQMPPASRQHLTLESTGARDDTGQNGWYYPILYLNTFWQLRDHMTELNNTVKTLPLHIDLNNIANWKFNIYASVDENIKANQRQVAMGGPVPAGGDGSEFEEVKRVLVETNIWLLGTTGIVSVFHMIFEMLAFKSDVSHWRHKKDNVGVSVRTILANVFMQVVILLYLIDNMDGTSYMILFGQGMGIVIEAWKITKTVDVRIREAPGSAIPYRIAFEDKHVLSETEKKTQEYDQIAFKYMYMLAVPLLIAYATYSVMYDTHKGWYSFTITTLVGSVYAYGFLMMVPSLYINYRLQVRSLPRPPNRNY